MTQVPGGWLADRYGGKRVLGFTILTGSILTILMPVSARASVYAVYVIRVCLGLLTVSSHFAFMYSSTLLKTETTRHCI